MKIPKKLLKLTLFNRYYILDNNKKNEIKDRTVAGLLQGLIASNLCLLFLVFMHLILANLSLGWIIGWTIGSFIGNFIYRFYVGE